MQLEDHGIKYQHSMTSWLQPSVDSGFGRMLDISWTNTYSLPDGWVQ